MDVQVLVVEGVFDSALSAVLDVLGAANVLRAQMDRPPEPWDLTIVAARSRIRTGAGLTVDAQPWSGRMNAPDLLIVPALGFKPPEQIVADVEAPRHRPALDLVRRAHDNDVELAGACTGTFLLAESGVLDGISATTSWWLGPLFRERYPRVKLNDTETLVRDGIVTTAGAAYAHIDLALSIVARRSPALADLVARYLLIGTHQSQSSFMIPALLAQHHPAVSAFEQWIRGRLDQPISVSAAASALSMSERSLQRATATTVGMSPLDFVQEIRIDHATHLLRTTDLTVDTIAARVGYLNAGTLRALVKRRRKISLQDLRRA